MPTTTRKVAPFWDEVHYGAVYYAIRTSAKQRPCDGCEHDIVPGQKYLHIVWNFPWTLIADDVDDEGRTIGSPAGEFTTSNVHRDCMREDRG